MSMRFVGLGAKAPAAAPPDVRLPVSRALEVCLYFANFSSMSLYFCSVRGVSEATRGTMGRERGFGFVREDLSSMSCGFSSM